MCAWWDGFSVNLYRSLFFLLSFYAWFFRFLFLIHRMIDRPWFFAIFACTICLSALITIALSSSSFRAHAITWMSISSSSWIHLIFPFLFLWYLLSLHVCLLRLPSLSHSRASEPSRSSDRVFFVLPSFSKRITTVLFLRTSRYPIFSALITVAVSFLSSRAQAIMWQSRSSSLRVSPKKKTGVFFGDISFTVFVSDRITITISSHLILELHQRSNDHLKGSILPSLRVSENEFHRSVFAIFPPLRFVCSD